MKRKEVTQDDRILYHLIDNGNITSWEAIKEYGITRLSAIIYRLRNLGYDIRNEWEFARNRYNEPVKYVRYKLKQKKDPWYKRVRLFM